MNDSSMTIMTFLLQLHLNVFYQCKQIQMLLVFPYVLFYL